MQFHHENFCRYPHDYWVSHFHTAFTRSKEKATRPSRKTARNKTVSEFEDNKASYELATLETQISEQDLSTLRTVIMSHLMEPRVHRSPHPQGQTPPGPRTSSVALLVFPTSHLPLFSWGISHLHLSHPLWQWPPPLQSPWPSPVPCSASAMFRPSFSEGSHLCSQNSFPCFPPPI